MEKEVQNVKIEEFKDSELVVPFIDGKLLMKIAGENKWYIVNENGDVVVRTRPDGTNEFSDVELCLEEGEVYDIDFSEFKDGIMLAKVTGVSEKGEEHRYIEISPSGYTLGFIGKVVSVLDEKGIEFRSPYWQATSLSKYPSSYQYTKSRYIESMTEIDFLYDIAQYYLVKQYEEFEEKRKQQLASGEQITAKQDFEYRRNLRTMGTAAKNMRKRYEELIVLVPRRFQREEESKQKKEEARAEKRKSEVQIQQETQEALKNLFGPLSE